MQWTNRPSRMMFTVQGATVRTPTTELTDRLAYPAALTSVREPQGALGTQRLAPQRIAAATHAAAADPGTPGQ